MRKTLAFLLLATACAASQIQVSWQDNSTAEDGFIVERSVDGVTFAEAGRAPANATIWKDNLPATGNVLYYQIRAYQQSGAKSAASNVTTWTRDVAPTNPTPPPANSALAAPSKVTATTVP